MFQQPYTSQGRGCLLLSLGCLLSLLVCLFQQPRIARSLGCLLMGASPATANPWTR